MFTHARPLTRHGSLRAFHRLSRWPSGLGFCRGVHSCPAAYASRLTSRISSSEPLAVRPRASARCSLMPGRWTRHGSLRAFHRLSRWPSGLGLWRGAHSCPAAYASRLTCFWVHVFDDTAGAPMETWGTATEASWFLGMVLDFAWFALRRISQCRGVNPDVRSICVTGLQPSAPMVRTSCFGEKGTVVVSPQMRATKTPFQFLP